MDLKLRESAGYDHSTVAQIPLEALQFRAAGGGSESEAYLLGTVRIGPALFHVDAIAVSYTEQGEQVADDSAYDSMLSDLVAAFSPDHPFEAIEINGRDYAIFLQPFC